MALSNRGRKLALGAAIGAAALGYLFWSGLSNAVVTTRTVSEYLESAAGRSRVTGTVRQGSVSRLEDGALQFVMEDDGGRLPVLFRDTVPDMFAEGRPVIIEGSLQGDGVFRADTLLTKCPSKYEEAPQGYPEGTEEPGRGPEASTPPTV